jgi:hypothetical protein
VLRWPALSKGLVLRAFGIRGRRGRRPMIFFLALLRSGKGQRVAQRSRRGVPSIRRRAKSAHLVAGSRCRFPLKWSIMRSRRPWSLGVRAALTHVFAIARPEPGAAPYVPARRTMGDLRLVLALEISESAIGLVQCNLLPLRCRCAAAQLPMRCGRLRFGGHRWWRF